MHKTSACSYTECVPHASLCLSIHSVFWRHLWWAQHCAKCWKYSSGQYQSSRSSHLAGVANTWINGDTAKREVSGRKAHEPRRVQGNPTQTWEAREASSRGCKALLRPQKTLGSEERIQRNEKCKLEWETVVWGEAFVCAHQESCEEPLVAQ